MFGIDEGPSQQEKGQYGILSNASGFALNQGEGDITAGSDFMKSILSGDASKITQALAPEISAAKTSANQTNKTNAQFGNRSGGGTAAAAATNDKVHSDITGLIGNLTGSSASGLLSAGSNLLNTGVSGSEAGFGEAKEMQAQKAAMWNDIFKSVSSVAGGVIGALKGANNQPDQASNVLAGAASGGAPLTGGIDYGPPPDVDLSSTLPSAGSVGSSLWG